ncbi:hypothetical protein [Campylobacter phage CAM-P21]|nr:hypothetical protein [Campylobacter phage CAM-P21]
MDARSKAPAHKAEFTSAVKLRERIKNAISRTY